MNTEHVLMSHERCIIELTEKIEELRKDINYNDQQVNNRINVMNAYLSREIAKVVKVVMDNATRDAFYNKLVEENKQLKKEIENLNKNINNWKENT